MAYKTRQTNLMNDWNTELRHKVTSLQKKVKELEEENKRMTGKMTDSELKAMTADRLGLDIVICEPKRKVLVGDVDKVMKISNEDGRVWCPEENASQGEEILESLNRPYTINKIFAGRDGFEISVYECTIDSSVLNMAQSQDKADAIFQAIKNWYEEKGL